jgi:methionine--tRNA ligase beta chain
MELFVDSSAVSSAARFLAAKAPSTKITEVTEEVRKTESFLKASPKGEVPAVTSSKGGAVGLINVASAFVPQDPFLPTSDADKKEADKQLKLLSSEIAPLLSSKDAKLTGKLHKINKDLQPVVFFLGSTASIVDLAYFFAFHDLIQSWSDLERSQFCNITRWFDFFQHYEGIHNVVQLPIVRIKKDYNPAILEKPKQEKTEAPKKEEKAKEATPSKEAQEPNKQEKKEPAKQDKKPPAKQEEKVDVSRLDIRVGKIVSVKVHEEADTLYVEQIDCGDTQPRTVVSGLRKFVPIEEMQNRLVVVLCNLKPSKLKGVLSEAMVLAASNSDHTQVELLTPVEGSKPGERVTFDGYSGEPDDQLNPKKKVWETVQPDFSTTDECVAVYKNVPFKTSAGIIKVKSITKGTVK